VNHVDADPYEVRCPDCATPAGLPCVYLPIKGVDLEFLHYRSPKLQARVALTGTPTKVPHNGRRNAAHELGIKRWRAALAKARAEAVRPASAARRQIARLESEFDRREYDRLRRWLAAYSSVLTDPAGDLRVIGHSRIQTFHTSDGQRGPRPGSDLDQAGELQRHVRQALGAGLGQRVGEAGAGFDGDVLIAVGEVQHQVAALDVDAHLQAAHTETQGHLG